MTFFSKYFNWLFSALCVAGVYYGKLSAGTWLLLFSVGTIVFIYFAIIFLRERNFFEQHLSAEDLARFKQLFPLINPIGIKIANPTWDAMKKERNDRVNLFILFVDAELQTAKTYLRQGNKIKQFLLGMYKLFVHKGISR